MNILHLTGCILCKSVHQIHFNKSNDDYKLFYDAQLLFKVLDESISTIVGL